MKRPRTIITTDGEVDDMNSFIRYLLYTNELDTAGIILTASVYHYVGYRFTGTNWINELIDLYGEVYDNLSFHDARYPSPESLKKLVHIGNISKPGEMLENTDGALFMADCFLDDDPSPLYVQTWGGTNTTAAALRIIAERYGQSPDWPQIKQRVSKKIILYIILDQDETYENYIAVNWPDISIIKDSFNFWHFAYAYLLHDDSFNTSLKADWLTRHIKFNHGPLLARYALMGDGLHIDGELEEEQRGSEDYLKRHPEYHRYDFISEGDSPSFLFLLDRGLRSLEDPAYGGWGGRFKKNPQGYSNDALDYNPLSRQYEAQYSLIRWFDDFQNDFAARADWCVSKKANHMPSCTILQGLDLKVKPGSEIKLTAVASDPDHDPLTCRWYRYAEADTYQMPADNPVQAEMMNGMILGKTRQGQPDTRVVLENANTFEVTIHIPKDLKKNETIHVICEIKDNGTPPLKVYRRIILTGD